MNSTKPRSPSARKGHGQLNIRMHKAGGIATIRACAEAYSHKRGVKISQANVVMWLVENRISIDDMVRQLRREGYDVPHWNSYSVRPGGNRRPDEDGNPQYPPLTEEYEAPDESEFTR